MDPRIIKFIKKHHVLTLATLAEQGGKRREQGRGQGEEQGEQGEERELWACNLFYTYAEGAEGQPALVFTSDEETEHARQFKEHPGVAGSIVLETKIVGKLQGLQFRGIVKRGDEWARKVYLKRFPFAAVMLKELWTLEITHLKYTDNTLGFGTKLHWNK